MNRYLLAVNGCEEERMLTCNNDHDAKCRIWEHFARRNRNTIKSVHLYRIDANSNVLNPKPVFTWESSR